MGAIRPLGLDSGSEELQKELAEASRRVRHADTERARSVEQASGVVEKAIMKREWALEVLDRSTEAEEEFSKRLHYEFYLAAAMVGRGRLTTC